MKLIQILFLLFVGTQAHAGLMLEPSVGMESGSIACTAAVGGANCDATLSGTRLGVHVGYKFIPMLWVAGSYEMGTGTLKSGSASNDSSRTYLGADAGLDFILGLRAWVGVGMTNDMTVKSTTGDIKYKGTSTKVGVAFSPLPLFSFNLEYYMDKYSKIEMLGTSFDTSLIYSKLDSTRTVFSVSLPLNL